MDLFGNRWKKGKDHVSFFFLYFFRRKLPEGEKLRGIYLAMFLIFAIVARKRREREEDGALRSL